MYTVSVGCGTSASSAYGDLSVYPMNYINKWLIKI